MSQIELAKKLVSQIKKDRTDYLLLIENQNSELNIDSKKYWIGNALITTYDLLSLERALRKTRL